MPVALVLAAAALILPRRPGPAPRRPAEPRPAPMRLEGAPAAAAEKGPFGAFRAWAERYAAAAPAERRVLEAAGERLALARREALRRLIDTDPERAIATALPRRIAAAMPPAVARHLEERVSARGDLLVRARLPRSADGSVSPSPAIDRRVRLGSRELPARVYGRRVPQPTTLGIPLHGIALDGVMAVHESPVRRLEPGEAVPGTAGGSRCPVSGRPVPSDPDRSVDVGGEIATFCHTLHREAHEQALRRSEEGVGPMRAAADGTATAASGATMASSWTEGPKAVLYIRVDFSDTTGDPITAAAAQAAMDNEVNPFYVQNSYGRTSLATTVTPLLRMPQTKSWYRTNDAITQFHRDAEAVAEAAGYPAANYDRIIVASKSVFSGFAGLADIGGKGVWLNGSFLWNVAAHELGHTYGLIHANATTAENVNLINPSAGDFYNSNIEYGNPYDVMGSISNKTYAHHFNAVAKRALNWIPPAGAVTAATTGVYRVSALENAASGPQLLRVPYITPTGFESAYNYQVEFRAGIAGDASLQNGVPVMVGVKTGSNNWLLDLTPETSSRNDSALPIGRTLSDANSGLYITPLERIAASPPAMDVAVERGAFAGNAAPAVAVTASRTAVLPGRDVLLAASGSDPNGDALAYFWDVDGALAAANRSSVTLRWSATGTYRVRCVANDLHGGTGSATVAISVSNSAPTDVDFVVDGVSAAVSGRSVTIADTVRNAGTEATASAFYVRYYLSADPVIASTDVLLGSRSIAGLGVGAVSTATVSFTAPSTLPAGTYYAGAVADATNAVSEVNETNNALASGSTFPFRPDLSFSALSAAVSAGQVSIPNTLSNGGTAATAGSFSAAFYLSADNLPGGDSLLGTRSRTTALAVGGSDSATSKFSVPAATPPGDYFVIGRADSSASQAETNESNNAAATSARLSIRADLYASSLSATRSGTTLSVTDTVKNQGPLAAPGSFRVDFYLSPDTAITTADAFLGSRTVAASLAYGASSSATTSLAVPQTLAPGSYRVGVIVDGGGQVPETAESNNTKYSSSIDLYPDLSAVSLAASASGRTVTFSDTVRNDGALPARAGFRVDLKLSADSTIGSGDPLLGSRTIPSDLAPGASSSATTVLPAPPAIPAGAYYGGMWADGALALPELSESNNRRATAGTLSVGP